MSARRIAAVAGLALLAALSGCGGPDASATDCDEFRFDRAAWMAAERRDLDDDPRERIAEGLVDCGVLAGKSAKEVRALLGRPDSPSTPRAALYAVGFGLVDPLYLRIEFDRSQRFRKAAIYEY